MLVLPIIAAAPRLARAFIRDTAVMIFWYVPLRLAQVPLVLIFALTKLRSRITRKPAPELMHFALK